MNNSKSFKLTDRRLINTSIENAYKKLIEPSEQVKWNTLYIEATTEPKGDIKNGTIMTGRFKGSGKATVTFENVIPNQ